MPTAACRYACRSLQPCSAVDRDIGGYTPSDYITWSEDPKQQCHHHAEVVVDAPVDTCFSLWMDWSKIIDFLDLVGQVWQAAFVWLAAIQTEDVLTLLLASVLQIGLDDDNPDMALLQCFYRWSKSHCGTFLCYGMHGDEMHSTSTLMQTCSHVRLVTVSWFTDL